MFPSSPIRWSEASFPQGGEQHSVPPGSDRPWLGLVTGGTESGCPREGESGEQLVCVSVEAIA